MMTSETRSTYIKVATVIALPLAFIALIPAFIGIYLVNKQAEENKKAIIFICSTTGVLDKLVVTARNSIKINLDNGTYEQLEATNVLPKGAVTQARNSLKIYTDAHRQLLNPPTTCTGK